MSGSAVPYERVLQEISMRPPGWQAMDVSHALLVAGLVAAHKPGTILELGIGSAFLTRVVLAAIGGNECGGLLSVDNFFDWQGRKPEHIAELEIRSPHWQVVVKDETDYLKGASDSQFDLVISDGDHTRGYQNSPEMFRVCKPGGLLLFHDTHSELYALLGRLPGRARRLGYPTIHFTRESRADEKTGRGLLLVSKDRDQDFTIDWRTRLFLKFRNRLPRSWIRRLRRNAVQP